MKKSHNYSQFLQVLPVFVIFLFSNFFISSCSGKKMEEGFNPDIQVPDNYISWFSEYANLHLWEKAQLGGNDQTRTLYTGSQKLSLDEVDQEREKVWEAWRRANIKLEEEKLIPLEPLSFKKSSVWHLPAELEPNANLNYYWGTKGEKPAEGWPLFLYIHGSGPRDQEFATGYKICSRFDDAPSTYFIPQIPNMGEWYRWWQKSKQFSWEKLIRQALVQGDFNPNRLYAFGISEGGYGSQRLASFYADYWAAAGPMAGGEPLINAPVENCKNMAFSLRTGAKDDGFGRNLITAEVKKEFEKFQAQYPGCFTHFIELIPGMGHGIDYNPTTPWLKQFSRNPYPKCVLWENMEMDGRYRDAFYNLKVLERSNPDFNTRTYYQMDIQGNEIDMKVDLVRYIPAEREPVWNIAIRYDKEYEPATTGKFIIYLCPELVDLNQPVIVKVNGKEVFNGKVELDVQHMINSCATYFDPMRIYPAAITVDLAE